MDMNLMGEQLQLQKRTELLWVVPSSLLEQLPGSGWGATPRSLSLSLLLLLLLLLMLLLLMLLLMLPLLLLLQCWC